MFFFTVVVNFVYSLLMKHPGIEIAEIIKEHGRTQKKFAILAWKKVSEVNELIKGKRNVTIQWDYILYKVLWTAQGYRIKKQIEYDYQLFIDDVAQKEELSEINNEKIEEIVIKNKEDESSDEKLTIHNEKNVSNNVLTSWEKRSLTQEKEDEIFKEKIKIFREF